MSINEYFISQSDFSVGNTLTIRGYKGELKVAKVEGGMVHLKQPHKKELLKLTIEYIKDNVKEILVRHKI